MHAVVNHLQFEDDVDPAIFASMDQVMSQMRGIAGFAGAHVVQTSAREVVLVILADRPETLDRVATEVGSPWMREHVVPLLAGPPDRRVGPVLISADIA
ncbi:MAG: hypothetical protein ACJ73J_09230 [Actinomycetes bacterium]